jgi:flagellar biosynthetic protein FlhB
VVLIGGIGIRVAGSGMASGFAGLMQSGLSLSRDQLLDENRMLPDMVALGARALETIAPILGLTLAAAVLSPLAIGGWNLSFQALVPDLTRLDPIAGLKRLFTMRGVTELAKAYAKFLLIGAVAVFFLRAKTGEILSLGNEDLNAAIGHSVRLAGDSLLLLAGALGVIAGIDVPLTLSQYMKQLRMSRQEVKQEARESDGSPEVKGRIRRMQQDAARKRMLQEVPKADVIITNPTHYSVALRYDEARMRAPVVAANIRRIAAEHNVPLFEAPPLARVLFRDVDLNEEVPSSLYVAVAQVLTYVLQLRTAGRHGAKRPPRPVIDPSIEEIRH